MKKDCWLFRTEAFTETFDSGLYGRSGNRSSQAFLECSLDLIFKNHVNGQCIWHDNCRNVAQASQMEHRAIDSQRLIPSWHSASHRIILGSKSFLPIFTFAMTFFADATPFFNRGEADVRDFF
jgi:hypothetical protein